MRINLLIGLCACALVYGLSGCSPQKSTETQSAGTQIVENDTITSEVIPEEEEFEDEFEEDNATNHLS